MAAQTFFSRLKSVKTSRRVAGNRRTTRRFRPRVEVLEAREVPATFTVNTLADENDGINVNNVSLREAIAAANDQAGKDTIQFSVTGTINLTGALPDLSSNIDITGPGANQLTVRRDTGGDYAIFTVGGGATVGISGLTVSGGSATYGGGISNSGTLVLAESAVRGNSGVFGGGIINSGTMTMTNSTISGNSAATQGGGMFNLGMTTVTGSTFSGNSGGNCGGGILNGTNLDDFATLTVINSTFSGNSAGVGGGLFNSYQDTMRVTNCTLTGNSGGGIANNGMLTITGSTVTGNSSGGIENGMGTLTITGSTVSGNLADVGAGISSNGTLTVANTTVSGNSATFYGGGIFNTGTLTVASTTVSGNSAALGGGLFNEGTMTVANITVTDNSAANQGGGVFNYDGFGTTAMTNTIAAGNSAPTDPNISGMIDAGNSFNNLIGTGNAGGLTTGPNGNIISVDVALVLNPTLADNGGPTKTYALIPGSPAINAGSNAHVPAGVTTDQRGFVRVAGPAVDIGAFELQQNQAPALSLPGAQATFEDVAVTVGGISFGEPDGSTKTVTLRANHGTLTLPSTNDLMISGNGKRAVSLSGSIANLNAALASLVYRGALNFGGVDSLLVTVSDGSLSTSGRVGITVKSSFRQAADLRAQVTALRTAGVLTAKQAYSLNINLFLTGDIGDTGKVKTFLNRVEAFLQSSTLTQAQADSLLGPGNMLLVSVKKR